MDGPRLVPSVPPPYLVPDCLHLGTPPFVSSPTGPPPLPVTSLLGSWLLSWYCTRCAPPLLRVPGPLRVPLRLTATIGFATIGLSPPPPPSSRRSGVQSLRFAATAGLTPPPPPSSLACERAPALPLGSAIGSVEWRVEWESRWESAGPGLGDSKGQNRWGQAWASRA